MCEAQATRGFEYVDERSIDPDLICSICTEPFIDPVYIASCHHVFCRSGIKQVLVIQPACPLCRHEPIRYEELLPADSDMIARLDDLSLNCQLCGQTKISRKDFQEHVQLQCPKAEIMCHAADLKCPWRGSRDQLDTHLASCRFQPIRDLLEPYVTMEKQRDEIRRLNQTLTSQVNGLIYRCQQLERLIQVTPYVPMRSGEISLDTSWNRNGSIVAGGNGLGEESNQLQNPQGIYVDEDETVYIADYSNHRVVAWKPNEMEGKVVAGGNGRGNRLDQLNNPTDVIVDKEENCLIISERGNRRVVSWPLTDGIHGGGRILIADIDCNCLTMDDQRHLYVTDVEKHEVRRWRLGETKSTVVAGGNGEGSGLHQLNYPTFVSVDRDYSVYVSDFENHRVMKWMPNATQGIVVAGGHGRGQALNQSSYPGGIILDQWGTLYVADSESDRIMRWPVDATEGTEIIGGLGHGPEPDRVNRPSGLTFDRHGNIYVAEYDTHRIQKFIVN